MTLPWREHPAARDDYLNAVIWYEDQEDDLGERWADSLDAAVDFVRQWPKSAPIYRGVRRLPQIRRKGVDPGTGAVDYQTSNRSRQNHPGETA